MPSPKETIEALVASNPVVVYAKSYCPHCAKTKALLTELGVHFVLVDLDQIPEGEVLQNALADLTGALTLLTAGVLCGWIVFANIRCGTSSFAGQRTVPNIFLGAKTVGGNSDLQALHASEQLVPRLKEVGALA